MKNMIFVGLVAVLLSACNALDALSPTAKTALPSCHNKNAYHVIVTRDSTIYIRHLCGIPGTDTTVTYTHTASRN